jgi:MFS family permease
LHYKWTVLTVTTVGVLMSGVEARIVVVGLPTIANQLNGTLGELIWATQAFVLATTICVPLIGRIMDILGRIKIYNIGFVVFTVDSALCSISFSPLELIASRIVQGAGSAMLTKRNENLPRRSSMVCFSSDSSLVLW